MYVTVRDDGELQIVAEAAGDEVYFGSTRSGDVVFGHQTHEAATEDHLIVAETSRGAIAVLDWSGREVAEIPLPAGARVSDARTVGRQVLLGRWQRFRERLNRLGATGQIPFKPRDFDPSGASEPDLKDWEEELLDARGDMVLLRQLDEFDVPRAVAIQLLGPPDDD